MTSECRPYPSIYQFFSKVGVVQDVRIIYDRNTPRSKGMAYVEFAAKDTVAAALATTVGRCTLNSADPPPPRLIG